MGVITAPNVRRMLVAVFLSDSPAGPKQADAWFAEIGQQNDLTWAHFFDTAHN